MTDTLVRSHPMPVLSQSSADTTTAAPRSAPATVVLNVGGMKCAGCVRSVEKQLLACSGVESATVNLVTEVAVVETSGDIAADTLAQRVSDAGFPTQPRAADAAGTGLTDWVERKQAEQRTQGRRLAIAIMLLLLSTIGHLKHFGWLTVPVLSDLWFHAVLATLTLVGPARDIVVDGWQGMRRLTPNMNTLVALGSLSAYGASVVALIFPKLGWECFFDEPVMLLSFILLGRTLEQRTRYRAADALRSLVELQPAVARLISDPTQGETTQPGVEVPVSCLQPGEWVRILPGEKVPADGEVVAGQSTLDESMLTGESMPVLKQPGDTVAAGTVNQSGALAVRVTSTGQETTLAQMITLVETAQSRKAPVQGLADVIAGYFTYGVMTLATLTFLFWYFIGLEQWPQAMAAALGPMSPVGAPSSTLLVSLKLAIAVLVVACPCALGLATPTAILVGSGLGAERGLLIRGGDVLEAVHGLQRVVFDKTGTLTQGQPQVTDTLVLDAALSETELLRLAATVESGTRHPLAIAIQQAAQAQGLALLSAQAFQTEPGLGITAQVSWQDADVACVIGNRAWLEQHGISVDTAAETQAAALTEAGKTVIYIARGQTLAGLMAVADQLRPEAQQVVQGLQDRGLPVTLLSGDQQLVAAAIASQLNLGSDQVMAEITPQGKVEAIQRFQAQGETVALVGDGINDAPALAQADIGITLNSGTDIAMETADVILMRDHLGGIAAAIDLSRATFTTIRQNLGWACVYNLVGIPLAAGALLPVAGISLSPAAAGGLMAFSSVAVVLNSLRLRQQRIEGL
ncbi:heavy metal translocating P-type ATPase [Halomicronema hongdechloris]|nr:heavy metal translocating P-type ATPase [Halomicronema hongdechloris]